MRAFPGTQLTHTISNKEYDSNALSTKGGVAIILPSNLWAIKVKSFSTGHAEMLAVKVPELDLACLAVYRRPDCSSKYFYPILFLTIRYSFI